MKSGPDLVCHRREQRMSSSVRSGKRDHSRLWIVREKGAPGRIPGQGCPRWPDPRSLRRYVGCVPSVRHRPLSGRTRGVFREAYVPTEQEAPVDEARLSRSYVHPRRPGRAESTSPQGPSPSVGLIDRLHRGHDFRRLRLEGTRVRSGVLWCMMLPDSSCAAPQVAFAIGRSVGSAVTRNRIRRRLREILRSTPLVPGLYLFGLTRDTGREPSFAELSTAARSIASRFGGSPA